MVHVDTGEQPAPHVEGGEEERFTLDPAAAGGWPAIAAALARKAEHLASDEERAWWLCLSADVPGVPGIQLEVMPWEVRAEIREDLFDPGGPRLDAVTTSAMVDDGWQPPDHFDGFHPGWWQVFPAPYDLRAICRAMVDWFSTGFDLPDELTTTLSVISGGQIV